MTEQEKRSLYDEISSTIQDEIDSYVSQLLSEIADHSDGNHSPLDHNYKLLVLRCERVAVSLWQPFCYEKTVAETMKEDFDEIISIIQWMQYGMTREEVFSGAVDCILAMGTDIQKHDVTDYISGVYGPVDLLKGQWNDEFAADFYWYGGNVFSEQGRNQDARNAFLNCYQIRKAIYGEKDWLTALARREYSLFSLMVESDQTGSIDFLRTFIDRIEGGVYGYVDEGVQKAIEGKTLYLVLLYKLNHNDFDHYEHLLNL
ncbi:MAG: hypothetical protein K6E75_12600, partial [Lachnospiraceae bacterium]|nr:hypothetical protein [Lachnospiraceae bacterium]